MELGPRTIVWPEVQEMEASLGQECKLQKLLMNVSKGHMLYVWLVAHVHE
jgi:hypothetical protein